MVKKVKILLIYTIEHPSLETDVDILSKYFDVETFRYSSKKDLFGLFRAIFKSDLNVSRFVLEHATWAVLISKFLLKKSIVMIEGFDVVNMPEINYGALRSKKMVRGARFALKYANAVVAVSKSLRKDAEKLVNRDIKLIYHCIDSEKYKPDGEKKEIVLTIGTINNITILRKGLKTFVESAKFLPNIEFYQIGAFMDSSIDKLKSQSPDNMHLLGYVPDEQMMKYLHEAKVYVQVSAHEGFGISLAEAMLCECVPVITDRGAIPEVVGDCGFYVPFDEPEVTAEAIKSALQSNLGPNARNRIMNNFSIKEREKKLSSVIWEVLGKDPTE